MTREWTPAPLDLELTIVPAPPGATVYPSEMTCARCGLLAMPFVGPEDVGRPGCKAWVCWVCGRAFEVRLEEMR
jgi:hypothetical protein